MNVYAETHYSKFHPLMQQGLSPPVIPIAQENSQFSLPQLTTYSVYSSLLHS